MTIEPIRKWLTLMYTNKNEEERKFIGDAQTIACRPAVKIHFNNWSVITHMRIQWKNEWMDWCNWWFNTPEMLAAIFQITHKSKHYTNPSRAFILKSIKLNQWLVLCAECVIGSNFRKMIWLNFCLCDVPFSASPLQFATYILNNGKFSNNNYTHFNAIEDVLALINCFFFGSLRTFLFALLIRYSLWN